MTIDELVEDAFETAKSKGFHDSPINIGEKIALVHSELSEGLEEVRNSTDLDIYYVGNKPEGFVVEMADAVIRIADLCGRLNLDLQRAVIEKLRFNKGRAPMHGRKF